MKKMFNKSIIAAAVLAFAATGCADMSPTQRGTATGAGLGAGIGALPGGTTGGGGRARAAKRAVSGRSCGALIGNNRANLIEGRPLHHHGR